VAKLQVSSFGFDTLALVQGTPMLGSSAISPADAICYTSQTCAVTDHHYLYCIAALLLS